MKFKLVQCQNSFKQSYYLLWQGGQSLVQEYHSLGQKCRSIVKNRLLSDERGFGMNELLGIAAALIIAGFVIIPSLRTFATSIMTGLTNWWNNTIASKIFPT